MNQTDSNFLFSIIIIGSPVYILGRLGGLMVSAPDSGLSDLDSSLGRGTALCSWARHCSLTVLLFTQVYRWVQVNLLLGSNLRWTSIPSRGE